MTYSEALLIALCIWIEQKHADYGQNLILNLNAKSLKRNMVRLKTDRVLGFFPSRPN